MFTISISSQVIHTRVKENGYEEWVFSALYASPNPRLREVLWEGLKEFANNNQLLWSITGDYNDIASVEESRSTAPDSNHNQRRKFVGNINHCKLMDVGASGPKFTWSNGKQGAANVQKRLDRGLCNKEWRMLFP